MPPPPRPQTSSSPAENIVNAASEEERRPTPMAPDSALAAYETMQFRMGEHREMYEEERRKEEIKQQREALIRGDSLQPYYAQTAMKNSANTSKNAKSSTVEDPRRSNRKREGRPPPPMSREASQEPAMRELPHDASQNLISSAQDCGRLHPNAYGWSSSAANAKQSAHDSRKPISPIPPQAGTHSVRKSRSNNKFSDSDDSDSENFLRYSLPEQVKILHAHVKKLQSKNSVHKKTINDQEFIIQRMEAAIEELRAEKEAAFRERDQAIDARDNVLNRLEQEKNLFQNRTHENDMEVTMLRNEVRYLKEEASTYQSALGTATNVRWSDDDSNNSVQLTNVINELQHALSDFAKVKGAGVKINTQAATKLLQDYKCKTRMSDSHPKPVLSGAIQRRVLDIAFYEIEGYLNNGRSLRRPPINEETLERDIVECTGRLIDLVTAFARARTGDDHITEVTAVKLRQQIYAILGSRAFATFNRLHPFIDGLRDHLLNVVNEYRTMRLDDLRQQEQRKEAAKLVRDITHLYFRLHTQEPVPEFRKFFESGEPLRVQFMAGPWNEGDLEDLVVEICSFPLIGFDETKCVLSKAQVMTMLRD